jgi:hypothetical protein
MADNLDGLRAAVAAVCITSPWSYTWFGTPAYRLASRWSRALSAEAAASHLTAALTAQLYRDYYTQGHAVPEPPGYGRPPDRPHTPTEQLPLRWAWESGWTVCEVGGDKIAVTRGDLTLWVPRSHSAPKCDEPQAGHATSVLLPTTSRTISPGFLVVNGVRPPTTAPDEALVRVYWNLRLQAKDVFLHLVTRALDVAGIGYGLKVLDSSCDRRRCDTAVLFVAASAFATASPVLGSLVGALTHELRDRTPAFTARLAPGVAVAESLGGDSFGRTRCRAVAEAIVATHVATPSALGEERFAAVLTRLSASGVRPDAPHLNPGSTANYTLRLGSTTRRASALRASATSCPPPLAVASQIACRLSEEAIWDGRRCNWLGFDDPAEPFRDHPILRALGADLFDGAAGIAIFLAHAARETGDVRAGRTAVGAARQAMALAAEESCADGAPVGLYCGAAGVAFAAAQVGVLLDQPDLLLDARRLTNRTSSDAESSEDADLVAGHAGRIVALLYLARLLDDPDLVRGAVRSGSRLLDIAVRRTGGWSWPTPQENRRNLHLTGFAHGAAGVGYGLAELYGATRDDTYRHAALRAFDYERMWFSEADGNWPDLRRTNRRAVAQQPVFGQAWCHGAAGIALSRLRSYDILGEVVLFREAQVALSTTAHALRRSAATGPEDYSLCHGVLGQVDVIHEGRLHAPGGRSETSRLTRDVARSAAAYARGLAPWPCGTPTGQESPGLMLGLAGIGYQHLRMARPGVVKSLLLTMPSERRRRSAAHAS